MKTWRISKIIKGNSWVIIDISTGKAVRETFSESLAMAVDRNRYEVLIAYDYLCRINRPDNAESLILDQ